MQNKKFRIFVTLPFVLIAVLLFNNFWSYKNYTLYENGKWESEKTLLKKGVVATWCMVFTKAGLSKNELNISAWQGYQELKYKAPINPTSVLFKCKSFNHPFAFYINKTDTLSEGFFLNYSNDSLCCFFKANKAGQFLFKQNFLVGSSINKEQWNRFKIESHNDSLFLNINGKQYFSIASLLPPTVNIGFRGSSQNVYIDDVSFCNAEKKEILMDDFSPPFYFNWQSILFFLSIIVLINYYKENTIYITVWAIMGTAILYAIYFFILSSRYPLSENYIDFKNVQSRIESERQVCQRLVEEYPVANISATKKIVLFIGSSQTWGAGVSNTGKTMPELIEDTLRKHFIDSSIIVINTGISGSTSDKLFAIYNQDWCKYKPVLTVINLSTNDYDTAVFRRSIREFLSLNAKLKTKTLLLAEPNDLFHSERLAINHLILKQEANKFKNIPVIEVQDYMDSCHTKGFIWWDYVHLTDYGYQLLSAKIAPSIINEMEQNSVTP